MATTGYDTLQQAVADAQKVLNDEKATLTSLRNDSTYIRQKAILTDPRVINTPNGWIDGAGVFWQGGDAQAQHAQGAEIVRTHEARIAAQQEVITNAEKTLDAARVALANYEKNSPIGQQAAIAEKDAAAKRTLIVTVVIIGVVVVAISIVFYFVRKKKKSENK